MLGQSARSIWRTCKCLLTIETGRMDPTNIIMFLLVFCVTGAMAVDPQVQKNQWNVLAGGTMWARLHTSKLAHRADLLQ